MSNQGSVSVVYGRTHTGKTVTAYKAHAHQRCLYIGRTTGADSIRHFLNIEPPCMLVNGVEEAIEAVKISPDKGYTALIVDDLSLLMESSERAWVGNDTRARFNNLSNLTAELREVLAVSAAKGVHSVITAHDKPAGLDSKGTMRPGGPKMPSWNMGESIVHEASLVLHVAADESRANWPVSFFCKHSGSWLTKDRYNVTTGRMFPDLRVLLAQRFTLDRHPTIAWFDKVIPSVVARTLDGQTQAEVFAHFYEPLTAKGKHPDHVVWMLQEGFAQAEIEAQRVSRRSALFAPMQTEAVTDDLGLGL